MSPRVLFDLNEDLKVSQAMFSKAQHGEGVYAPCTYSKCMCHGEGRYKFMASIEKPRLRKVPYKWYHEFTIGDTTHYDPLKFLGLRPLFKQEGTGTNIIPITKLDLATSTSVANTGGYTLVFHWTSPAIVFKRLWTTKWFTEKRRQKQLTLIKRFRIATIMIRYMYVEGPPTGQYAVPVFLVRSNLEMYTGQIKSFLEKWAVATGPQGLIPSGYHGWAGPTVANDYANAKTFMWNMKRDTCRYNDTRFSWATKYF